MSKPLILSILVMVTIYVQQTPFAIDTFELILMLSGSITYFILSCMNIIFIKKNFDISDTIMSAVIMFSVNIVQKVLGAILVPSADTNKDGILTASEFYTWKNSIDRKIKRMEESEI